MISGVLTAGLGAVATAIGFVFSSMAQRTDERSDSWVRTGALVKMLGAFILLSGMALMVRTSLSKHSMDSIVVTHNLSSPQFGLRVQLPASWRVESSKEGDGFFAVHADTGAILVGNVAVAAPNEDLDSAARRKLTLRCTGSQAAQHACAAALRSIMILP